MARSPVHGTATAGRAARVLRSLRGRSLSRCWSEGQWVALKSFHRGGLRGRWSDRARARREFAVLEALHRAGVAVPRPRGLRMVGPAAVVEAEWVRAARPLDAWLGRRGAPRFPWPVPEARLARDLGRLLARAQAAGLCQPDWHPGNLLLDRCGRWHALDFHAARLRPLRRPRALRELARLGGPLAERIDGRWLALAHRAWARALTRSTGAGLSRAALAAEAAELALATRRDRRREVLRHLDRWERPSGRLERRGPWLWRRDAGLCRAAAEELERDLADGATGTGSAPRAAPATLCAGWLRTAGRSLLLVRGRPREVVRLWRTAARLEEHALPGLAPLVRPPGPRPRWCLLERRAEAALDSAAAEAELARRGLQFAGPTPPVPAVWPLHGPLDADPRTIDGQEPGAVSSAVKVAMNAATFGTLISAS
jgi:hypothetical protein